VVLCNPWGFAEIEVHNATTLLALVTQARFKSSHAATFKYTSIPG
jgi:hypothetical protein